MIKYFLEPFKKCWEAVSAPQQVILSKFNREVSGQLKLNNITVSDAIRVNGECHATKVVFNNNLEVNGTAVLTDSIFHRPVLVRGTPHISNCEFKSPLEVLSDHAKFSGTTAQTVYMTSPIKAEYMRRRCEQHVSLLYKSQLKAIKFSRSGGKVFFDQTSKVSSVVNGKAFTNL